MYSCVPLPAITAVWQRKPMKWATQKCRLMAFSEEKIGWILVLDKEGRSETAVPNLTTDKSRSRS